MKFDLIRNPKFLIAVAMVTVCVVWWGCSEPESLPQMRGASTDHQDWPLTKERPSRLKSKIDRSGQREDVLEYRHPKTGKIETRTLTVQERSFVQMAQIFGMYLQSDRKRTDRDFIRTLRRLGLRPRIARDLSTGGLDDLAVVRTETSLPGIRYIHGQFDGEGGRELQHMSFEIKKGPGAYEKAIDLLQKSMNVGYKIPGTDERMTIFRNGDYVVWVKQMEAEDLIYHPFNVYDQGDIGNIRIAIERDPHAHEGP